jgi:hypothetical protein
MRVEAVFDAASPAFACGVDLEFAIPKPRLARRSSTQHDHGQDKHQTHRQTVGSRGSIEVAGTGATFLVAMDRNGDIVTPDGLEPSRRAGDPLTVPIHPQAVVLLPFVNGMEVGPTGRTRRVIARGGRSSGTRSSPSPSATAGP